MPLRENKLKKLLREGRVVYGSNVRESRDSGVVFAMARSGADFVFIDLEHTAMSFETAAELVAHAHAADTTPIIRIPDLDYASVTRLLDAGCQSLFIPHLKTPEDVQRLLDLSLFYPKGHRGMGVYGGVNVDYASNVDVEAATASMNDNLILGLNIETKEAIESLEDMLVPGIDFALVGLFDLSQSYGILGRQFDHPLIAEAKEKVRSLCAERGIAYAVYLTSVSQFETEVAQGAQMLMYGSTLDFVKKGVTEAVTTLRALTEREESLPAV
ncbi:MAG: staphyloferrin biosynthesis citrate synthase [Acidimicrobiaceae bacterium]|jgi:2-dehydro-3-deoxyglucarate aldolase/4-hydroxy-2-oxoheptanedioate aldolase